MAAMAMAPSRLLEELLLGPQPTSSAAVGEDGVPLTQEDGRRMLRSQRMGAAELHACLLRVRHREAATQRRIIEILAGHAPHFQSLLAKAYDATLESQGLRERLSYISDSVLGEGIPDSVPERAAAGQESSSRDPPQAGGSDEVRTLADWQKAMASAALEPRGLREQRSAQRKVVSSSPVCCPCPFSSCWNIRGTWKPLASSCRRPGSWLRPQGSPAGPGRPT